MKNKLRFVMPRLIGATVVVGLATFILASLFKLLLGLVLLGGAITLIARQAGKRRKQWMARNGQHNMPDFSRSNLFGHPQPWAQQMQPITATHTQKATTIVPIN